MALFDSVAPQSKPIFANELALDYSFVPKLLPYRENQQRAIAASIKPLFERRNGKNLIVFGPPGVGKTVACLHVLRELEEKTDEIVPCYVNCWMHNTSHKVMLELASAVGYKFVQNKSTEELFAIIAEIINKQAAVFVLDEIDKAEELGFLYSALEAIYKKSIILITNDRAWLSQIDQRLVSRLGPESLEFRPYSEPETLGILRERASYAFVPNTLEPAALAAIASQTYKLADIRIGLYLLREAGLAAEEASAQKIGLELARQAISKLENFAAKAEDGLDSETKSVLAVVRANSGKRIGEIYAAYQSGGGKLNYKAFYRKVQKLAENRFISAERVTGAEGNTTILRKLVEKKLTEFG